MKTEEISDGHADTKEREDAYQRGAQEATEAFGRGLCDETAPSVMELTRQAEDERERAREAGNQLQVDYWRGRQQTLAKLEKSSFGEDGYMTLEGCVHQARHIGGFLSDYINFNLSTAHRQQPNFALAGGLALIGVLLGRKIRDAQDTRTNVYFFTVGESGCGKDHARKVNNAILAAAGADYLMAPEEMTSDTALTNELKNHPAKLFQPDEIGRWLATADSKHSPHHFSLVTFLLKLFTSSTTEHFAPKGFADQKYNVVINQPHLAMLATSTPCTLYPSMGHPSVTNGLMGRVAIVEGDNKARKQKPATFVADVPESLVAFAQRWSEYRPGNGNLSGENPQPDVIRHSRDAELEFDDFDECCDEQGDGGATQSLWRRATEKARQYALCMAASRAGTCEGFQVELIDAQWSVNLSRAITQRMIEIVESHISGSKFEADCQMVERFIRRKGRCTLTELARGLRALKSRERSEVLTQLQQEGRIRVEESCDGWDFSKKTTVIVPV